MIKTEVLNFQFNALTLKLCIPNNHDLFFAYKQNNEHQLFPVDGVKSTFPYWAKVWHSAIATSNFITKHNTIFENKIVLELGAGLGLPGLVASTIAKNVIISDYIEDALFYVNQSVHKNNIHNVFTKVIDWNCLPQNIDFDILLMSDVNYEVHEFNNLEKIFLQYLKNNKTIVLATPQRLMAKQFIAKLLSFTVLNEEMEIKFDDEIQYVNILVLKNRTL